MVICFTVVLVLMFNKQCSSYRCVRFDFIVQILKGSANKCISKIYLYCFKTVGLPVVKKKHRKPRTNRKRGNIHCGDQHYSELSLLVSSYVLKVRYSKLDLLQVDLSCRSQMCKRSELESLLKFKLKFTLKYSYHTILFLCIYALGVFLLVIFVSMLFHGQFSI